MSRYLVPVLAIILLSSCSLLKVEFENEAVPLSSWQLSVRNGVQTYAGAMNLLVVSSADSIAKRTEEAVEIPNSILWKLGFASSIRSTAFVTDPELSLIDTWTFAKQHDDFMQKKSKTLFPENSDVVLFVSDSVLRSIESIAGKVFSPEEFSKRQEFVNAFAEAEPFCTLSFERSFILFAWKEYLEVPDSLSIVSVGNLPQVMSNFSTKFAYYTETAPQEVGWKFDLLKHGVANDSTLQADLDSTRAQLDRLVLVAEKSPEIVDSAMIQLDKTVARLQYSFSEAMNVLDKNWEITVDKLAEERAALTESLTTEREAVIKDLDEMSVRVADQALGHIKGIIRSVLIFAIVFILLLFGIPFFAGFYLGKFMQKRKKENTA